MTLGGIGLRARKKAARHAAFVAAARLLVNERGLDAVTIEDVCGAVGVSPRTFFNYFASKEDAVLGIGIEESGASPVPTDLAATFARGGPTGDLFQDLAVLVAAILADPVSGPHRIECVFELIKGEPRLLGREVHRMEERRAALELLLAEREHARPSGIDAAVAGVVVMSLLRGAIELWNASDKRGEPIDYLPVMSGQLRRLVQAEEMSEETKEESQ